MSPIDNEVLNIIRLAFQNAGRPQRFTVEDGDPECMEHDRMWRSKTPATLTFEDVFPEASFPCNELLAEGLAHFLPAIVKIVMESDHRQSNAEWPGMALALSLLGKSPNSFLDHCSPDQRRAVARLLHHLLSTRHHLIDLPEDREAFRSVAELWNRSAS